MNICANKEGNFMNQLIDDLLLGKYLKENNVREIKDRQSQQVIIKGDHYLSIIWKEMIKVITMNGKMCKKNFIIKAVPDTELGRKYEEKEGVFKKEIHMYTEVLPLMEEQIYNCEDGGELLWPKLIAVRPYDVLILEDLCFKGFRKVDRMIGLDYDHALLVYKAVAKFHVLSLAIKHKFQGSNSLLANFTFANSSSKSKELFSKRVEILTQLMLNNWEEKWHKLAKFLLDHSEEIYNKHIDLCKLDAHNFNVINHGDLWTSNLLFKYCEFTDKLIGIRFVDFQMSHFGSFAIDLQYILQASVQPEIRKHRSDELLAGYHETLVATARKICNLSADIVIPSLSHIKAEMLAKQLSGIYLSIYLLDLMLVKADEAPDLDTLLTPDEIKKFGPIIMNNEVYKMRLQAIFEPFIEERAMESLLKGS